LSEHFSTYFFHSHPFNETFIVNGKYLTAVTTLLLTSITVSASKNI